MQEIGEPLRMGCRCED